jgi:hypothetical protein
MKRPKRLPILLKGICLGVLLPLRDVGKLKIAIPLKD